MIPCLRIACPACLLLVLLLLIDGLRSSEVRDSMREEARWRRPTALALAGKPSRLYIANGCGSISIVDPQTLKVTGETSLGQRLADLLALPDGRLLCVDEQAHELILLSAEASAVRVLQRLPVADHPVSVQRSHDGKHCVVVSLWSRRLTIVALNQAKLVQVGEIRLPHAPRVQLALPMNQHLIADAFGGKLTLIDLAQGKILSTRTLPGHNLRGLTLSADGQSVLVAHQILQPTVETTRDNIHWGNLLTNHVRALALKTVQNPEADLLPSSRLFDLDEIEAGAADPAGLLALPSGDLLVSLSGVGEVLVHPEQHQRRWRKKVGQRPTALLAAEGQVWLVDTLGDAVVRLNPTTRQTTTVSLGPTPTLSAREQGERLFYDARLSHDGWMSCHSCHTDGHTCGLSTDNLGDGSYGTPKRILSLRGAGETGPWLWDGSAPALSGQIRKSIVTTMRGETAQAEHVSALAAYVRGLPPAPGLGRFNKLDSESHRRGQALFADLGCNRCHTEPLYTSAKTYEVGLTDELGRKAFNPPSLRGVSQGGPYFHDASASTLEEVVQRHQPLVKRDLTAHEQDDLLNFLRAL